MRHHGGRRDRIRIQQLAEGAARDEYRRQTIADQQVGRHLAFGMCPGWMGRGLAVDPRMSFDHLSTFTDVPQCSHDENFAYLNRKDGNPAAIKLLNPATQEFQIVRTSLIPGLLKTLRENKALALPLRIFECSDIAVQDAREERMCRNYRHLGAAYTDKKGGFEVVHGLLDRVMQMLEVPFIGSLSADAFAKATHGYYIREAQGGLSLSSVLKLADSVPDEMYFPGRAATIHYRPRASTNQTTENQGSVFETVAKALKDALPTTLESSSTAGDVIIGSLGILHPTVLENFSLVNPCSVLEINVEPFL